MQRTVKNRIAAGMTAAACSAVLALAGSAQAQAAPAHTPRDLGTSLNFTVDFTHTTIPGNPLVGASFVGHGVVTDQNGNQIGTAVDHCDEDSVSIAKMTVQCTSIVNLPDGELDLVAEAPIPDNPLGYPYSFEGIVQGGTGAYDGARGDAHFTAEEPAVYQVQVQFAGGTGGA